MANTKAARQALEGTYRHEEGDQDLLGGETGEGAVEKAMPKWRRNVGDAAEQNDVQPGERSPLDMFVSIDSVSS